MTILHALRGLEATSGISTFVVELCRFQIEAGHRVYFVYQRALELEHAQGVIVPARVIVAGAPAKTIRKAR